MSEDIRRLTRRQLYDLVWKTPAYALARDFGLSGRGLGKLCERNGIPVPPRGYWARKAAGQRVKRPPLIELADGRHPEIVVDLALRRPSASSSANESNSEPDPYCELYERQLREIGTIIVPKQLRNPHPIIAGWLKQEELDHQRARASLYVRGYFEPRFSSPLARRRLRILNTLLRELERRGCSIQEECDRRQADLVVRLSHDSIGFTLSERIRQVRRRLTEAEKAERPHTKQEWTQAREATGELILKVAGFTPKGLGERWQDKPDRPLEGRLPEILAGLLTTLAYARERREEREAEERRRRQREAEELRKEEARQAELQRQLGFRQRAKAWQVAGQLRDYVAAVRDAADRGEISADPKALDEWAAWALAHADEIDPVRRGNALETTLLWEEERPDRTAYGAFSYRPSGDPNWFWGRRWWLKS